MLSIMVAISPMWLIRVTLINIKLNKKVSASVPRAHVLDSADMEHFILDSSIGQRCYRIKQNNSLDSTVVKFWVANVSSENNVYREGRGERQGNDDDI